VVVSEFSEPALTLLATKSAGRTQDVPDRSNTGPRAIMSSATEEILAGFREELEERLRRRAESRELSAPLRACKRVRADYRREFDELLDHGVDLLVEDPWRSPFGDHPLSPRDQEAYPRGKQVFARMAITSPIEQALCDERLELLQDAKRAEVDEQRRAYEETVQDRLRASRDPRRIDVDRDRRFIAELERLTRLTIDEIREVYRRGQTPSSLRQRRRMVDDAVRAMILHHGIVHPVLADQYAAPEDQRYGEHQWRQWRESRGYAGQNGLLRARSNAKKALETFGDVVEKNHGTTGRSVPIEYSLDHQSFGRESKETGGRRGDEARRYIRERDPTYRGEMNEKSQKYGRQRSRTPVRIKTQVIVRLARVLNTSVDTVRRIK
jgi:hypothetical protein